MERKQILSMVAIFVIAFGAGFGGSFLLPSNGVGSSNNVEGAGVKITSITDNQEVHSVVVVDAAVWGASRVEVLVNDELVANYLPFEWNNMLEPVGEYDITVNIYGEDGSLVSSDTKIVVIAEEFIVPENYNFTEDFVVHEGQTVYFNYGFDIATPEYTNGYTPSNELKYFTVNVFGNLIINTSETIKCDIMTVENDGELSLIDNSDIELISTNQEMLTDIPNEWFLYEEKFVRLDDNAILNIGANLNISGESFSGSQYKRITLDNMITSKKMNFLFLDNAWFKPID